MDVILGIDFGTSKIAFAFIDPDKKRVVNNYSIPIDAYLHLKDPSLKEQDVKRITHVFHKGIRECLAKSNYNVLSIGLTGQMHGILGLNKEGKAITNLVTWQDGRGHCKLNGGITLIQEMHKRAGKRPVASGYGIVTLYDWARREKDAEIKKFCTLGDYFAMLLTGEKVPVMEHTMADSTGAFDAFNQRWDFDYIDALGINRCLFPETVSSTTVIGVLKDPFVKNPCKKSQIPITVSIGDNQASYLGSVREHFKSLLINIGTGSQVSFAVKNPEDIIVQGLIDGYDVVLRPFVRDTWLVAGNAISGGVVYRALYDFIKRTGEELFGIVNFEKLWDKMGELAQKVNDCGGLSVYPLFAGKRSDPEARGRIEGIDMENLTPANLIRATLRGVVAILKDMINQNIIEEREYLIGSGNGIRRNSVLREITSELFKKKIMIPAHEEEAAVGAALNGGVASGVFRNFDKASEVVIYESQETPFSQIL